MLADALFLLAAKSPEDDRTWSGFLVGSLIFLALAIIIPLCFKIMGSIFRSTAKTLNPPPQDITHEILLKSAETERSQRQATMAMHGVDSAFDTEALCLRVRHAFEKLQQAVSDDRLRDVHAFMSDGVHERLLSKRAELEGQRRLLRIPEFSIAKSELCEAAHEGTYEHAAIRIEGMMTRVTELLEGGGDAGAAALPTKFHEVWTFLRQRRKFSIIKRGLIEGYCPCCGATLEMNQHTHCTHCNALLRNGKFDWVLIEISQGEMWTRARQGEAIGADAMQVRDACFNTALLEDRASVMFERWLTAHRTGRMEPLRKVATDAFCDQMAAPVASGTWYRDCTVDSVRTRGIIPGNEFDKALIEICWDASVVHRKDPPGARPERNIISRQLMVLKRRHNVKSEVPDGFGAAHCPHCGAPESINPETACPNCGTGVNDGSLTWNLMDVVPISSALARQYLELLRAVEMDSDAVALGRRKIGTNLSSAPTRIFQPRVIWRVALLAWSIELARSDGTINDLERQCIIELGLRMDMTVPRIEALLNARTLEFEPPKERGEMNLWLGELTRLSMVDGAVSERESALLVRLAQQTGMNESEARMTISKARLKQYENSPIDLKSQWQKGRENSEKSNA